MAINRFHLTLSSTYRSNYRFRESVVSLSKSNHPESAPDSDFLSATSKLSVWRNASACAPTEWLTAETGAAVKWWKTWFDAFVL